MIHQRHGVGEFRRWFRDSTVLSLTKYGRPREGEHNAVETFVANALMMWLLYEGGFFSP